MPLLAAGFPVNEFTGIASDQHLLSHFLLPLRLPGPLALGPLLRGFR
jgi:hypothetical protein